MHASSVDQDTRAQDPQPQHSSMSQDCGIHTTSQPVVREDRSAQESPQADQDRYHAHATSPDQSSSAQIITTPIGDESRLPHAVVIPQRRPSDRARGFIRAYAPDLLRCGIDQVTFLRFVDGLNKSVASNSAVEAVDLAGEAVGAIPGSEFVGAPIVGAALQVAAGAYKEVNARIGYAFPPSYIYA